MKRMGSSRAIISLATFLALLGFIFANASFAGGDENIKYIQDVEEIQKYQNTAPAAESFTGESILIRLGNKHFDPLKSLPPTQAGIRSLDKYQAGEYGYYLVQFNGPIKSSWKKELINAGAEVFDYVPDFTYIIRMDSNLEEQIRTFPQVRWLGIYQPSYRISQSASDAMLTANGTTAEDQADYVFLRVTVFPGEDLDRIRSEIADTAAVITEEVSTKWKTSMKVKAPLSSIGELPSILGVKYIELMPKWKLYNNKSNDIMEIRTPRDTYGYYGQGQTVAVCDTGLDQGSTNPANLHDDFEDGQGNSRVLQIFDRVGDGANDVNSGHGTHVAGSVLGNGFMSGSTPSSNLFPPTSFTGSAPKANLIFQAVEENSSEYLTGLPIDLNLLFQQADDAGADIHTNSWGAPAAGMYTGDSQAVDEYVWDHRDFVILFAAGNEGSDMDGNGVIDPYSLGSPATAKNCLTVGASENDRPSGEGYDFDWGFGWPYDYSAPPISNDHLSDNPEGMAAFSSRGPTVDGRSKPDVTAPGTNILSTRSSQISGSGWGPYNEYYMYFGGTSMSTPLTAGATALVREHLMKSGQSSPSAALVKATLLNGAEDLSPGQYGTGTTQEIPDSPVPNNIAGWGRVNVANVVNASGTRNAIYYDEKNSLQTGQSKQYQVAVTGSSSPLKINLVWTDYPGTPAAQGGLVNDLDLKVTSPSLTDLYADHASQESSLTALAYDDDFLFSWSSNDKRAMRFTPASYPAKVETTSFFFYNPYNDTSDVDIVVYDDDGAGGLPGTELFRKTLTWVPTGWITIGIPGVTIASGDFYVAVEKISSLQYIFVDDNSNPTQRSYWHNGSEWAVSAYTVYIRANIRGNEYSTDYDRVNNTLGLTLDNPATGIYTITVSGYNVPQGPQPYALVISGDVAGGGGGSGFLPAVYSILLF